jgi:hypothetical protein
MIGRKGEHGPAWNRRLGFAGDHRVLGREFFQTSQAPLWFREPIQPRLDLFQEAAIRRLNPSEHVIERHESSLVYLSRSD